MRQRKRLLAAILLYGLVITSCNLDFNSVYHDEALNILMGRQVLNRAFCPGCAQNTGSVLIYPVLAAAGDYLGGLHGARAIGIVFGLGLTLIVYLATRTMLSEKHAMISALLFTLSGNLLYLSKLATYDIVSAFFLGLSFLLLLLSEQKKAAHVTATRLFFAAFTIFLAAMTKYVVIVFIPFFLLYVFIKHRIGHAILFFLLPLSVFVSSYWYTALYPVRDVLIGSITSVREQSQVPFSTLSSWTLRWVIMPYLLACIGIFQGEKGRKAIPLIVLASPIIILHLATGAEQSINKNVIYSIIFLAPAASLGIDHLSSLFSVQSDTPWVKKFFTAALIVVLWAYGISELRWLEKQYPDMSPVVEFLHSNGHDGMTVTLNSDFGESVFAYSLGSSFQNARFLPFTALQETNPPGVPFHGKADFVIIDNFYGKEHLMPAVSRYMQNDYFLARVLRVPLMGETESVRIYRRR